MNDANNAPITEDDIADYLVNTPDFFERHADVLSSVQLTSPHSHRTISLQERQAEMMRAKIRELELSHSHMVRYGQNNVAIADKMNAWTASLLSARSASDLPALVRDGLAQAYAIPQVGLRLWGLAQTDGVDGVVAQDDALVAETGAMLTVYCGAQLDNAALNTLADAQAVKSMAVVPLRASAEAGVFGVLVFGSDDDLRFTPDMGTLFLERVSALASAALSRLLPEGQ
jgi:uncharacterized protein